MYMSSDTARPGGILYPLRRAEAWLDARGKWAWIALLVLGFIFVWPLALLLLAYMIWGKKMFARSCSQRRSHDQSHAWDRHAMRAGQPTGNRAFDDYKAQALRRLEEEQEAFEAFLQRLRSSKDKSEFDSFMDERARATAAPPATETDAKPEPAARPGEY